MQSNILEATAGIANSQGSDQGLSESKRLEQSQIIINKSKDDQRDKASSRYATEIKNPSNSKLLKINKPDLVNLISPRQRQKMRNPPNFK